MSKHRDRANELIQALPAHAWDVRAAALSLQGITKSYALTLVKKAADRNTALNRRIEAAKAEVQAGAEPERAEIFQGLRSIARDSSASNADKLRAYELLGKSIAMFTDRVDHDHSVYLGPPADPETRARWLEEQRQLLARQARAGTAIAGEVLHARTDDLDATTAPKQPPNTTHDNV